MESLTEVRLAAHGCRSAARTDVIKACALLTTVKREARPAFASALVRCLHQSLGKTPVFYRPGVAELSFDESWLTSALRADQAGDQASFAFLLRRRVPFERRRAIGYLIHGLVDGCSF